MTILQRWRICNWLMDGWKIGGEGEDKNNLRIDCVGQTPANIRRPTALVDFWSRRILGRLLPTEERQPIVEFMAAGRNPDQDLPADQIAERLRFMVGLIFMSPSFQWR
jgi:hypothetical protein